MSASRCTRCWPCASYGGRWGPRLLRAALVSVLYGLTLGLALSRVAVVALLG